MTEEGARTLRVAALQVRSEPGKTEANLNRAAAYVEAAGRSGAQLIVLPELFAPGYVANEDMWSLAEPPDGTTRRWLADAARHSGAYVGAGFATTDGRDVFNVFALATPDGKIAGEARKDNAEAYVFRRGMGVHVIETALGKVGVGICADNQFVSLLRLMQQQGVDIVLMPHAVPSAVRTGGAVSAADIEAQRRRLEELPLLYARHLGVPVVFVNQTGGSLVPMAGLIGKLMNPAVWRFQGRSRIVDSDGSLVAEMGDEEGTLLANVALGAQRKRATEPVSYGGWVLPGSALARNVVIPLDAAVGTLSYRLRVGRRRAAVARAVAVATTGPL